jgi:hypothetical protein
LTQKHILIALFSFIFNKFNPSISLGSSWARGGKAACAAKRMFPEDAARRQNGSAAFHGGEKKGGY